MRTFGMSAAMLGLGSLAAAVQLKPMSEEERAEHDKRRALARAAAEIKRVRKFYSCGHIGKPDDYYRKRNVPKKLRKKP